MPGHGNRSSDDPAQLSRSKRQRRRRGQLICAHSDEPPILAAQSPLGTDRVAVADQQHPDHQLRIHQRAADLAVEWLELLTDQVEVEQRIQLTQQMVRRNLVLEPENCRTAAPDPLPTDPSSSDPRRDRSHRDRITAQASPQHAFFNSSSHQPTFSGELVEQRFCLLEVGSFKAFGEPAIDRRKQVVGLTSLSLLCP
jgi:hypothetical protein